MPSGNRSRETAPLDRHEAHGQLFCGTAGYGRQDWSDTSIERGQRHSGKKGKLGEIGLDEAGLWCQSEPESAGVRDLKGSLRTPASPAAEGW